MAMNRTLGRDATGVRAAALDEVDGESVGSP